MVVMGATPFVLRAETSDGSLWFTEFTGNKIGKISKATGAIVEYPLPEPLSGPISLTLASDGNIYTDESLSNKIAKLVPATGVISEMAIPAPPGAFPDEIRFGTGNKIWFPELVADQVGSMTLF
jgi:virginiamycin B lyase